MPSTLVPVLTKIVSLVTATTVTLTRWPGVRWAPGVSLDSWAAKSSAKLSVDSSGCPGAAAGETGCADAEDRATGAASGASADTAGTLADETAGSTDGVSGAASFKSEFLKASDIVFAP